MTAPENVIKTETRCQDEGSDWMTEEELEEACCDNRDEGIPCRETHKAWNGYTSDEILEKLGITLDDEGRDAEGNFVEIKYSGGIPCGDLVTSYDSEENDCCEGIDPLEWDATSSATVMAPSSSATVQVSAGLGPYIWTIAGTGFSLGSLGKKTLSTTGPSVTVVTDETACGFGQIEVVDQCSTANGGIRCTVGQWVLVDNSCGMGGTPTEVASGVYELVSGGHKQIEKLSINYFGASHLFCIEAGPEGNTCQHIPCCDWYSEQTEAARPAGVQVDTCFSFDMADFATPAQYLCGDYLWDGSLVIEYGGVDGGFICRRPDGSVWMTGATTRKKALYATSATLEYYEWVC